MPEEEESEFEPMQILPPNTNIFAPDEINQVVLQFPTAGDAIVFFEFLKSFASGEIKLEIVK